MHLKIKFWGVRGSVPAWSPTQQGVGGNTSCVEAGLDCGHPIIIDAGTGLRSMGLDLMERVEKGCGETSATVLLSHLHWDHIQGIPFFEPLYHSDWTVTFRAARPLAEVRRAVRLQTSAPYFPASWAVKARIAYRGIQEGGLELGGIRVTPYQLNHPGGSSGFRLDVGGRSVVYASDHEHGDAAIDAGLRVWAHGADVVIWDSQYTPEEYPLHARWGHGTWLEGVRMARDADAAQLVLFHHDPHRTDGELEQLEAAARMEFANTILAREGFEIQLPL